MLVFYTRKTEIEASEAEGQALVVDAELLEAVIGGPDQEKKRKKPKNWT